MPWPKGKEIILPALFLLNQENEVKSKNNLKIMCFLQILAISLFFGVLDKSKTENYYRFKSLPYPQSDSNE